MSSKILFDIFCLNLLGTSAAGASAMQDMMSPVGMPNGEQNGLSMYESMHLQQPMLGARGMQSQQDILGSRLQGQDLIAAQQFLQTQQNYLRQQGVHVDTQNMSFEALPGNQSMPTNQLILPTGQDLNDTAALLPDDFSTVTNLTPELTSPTEQGSGKKKKRSKSKKHRRSSAASAATPPNADNKMDKLLSSTNTKDDHIDLLLDSSFNFDNLKDLSAQKFDLDELLNECTPMPTMDPNALFNATPQTQPQPTVSTPRSLLATTPPAANSNSSVWDNLDKVPSFEESIMNKRSTRKSGDFEAPPTPVGGATNIAGSWMNGSMGIYTCVCGTAFTDWNTLQQHEAFCTGISLNL